MLKKHVISLRCAWEGLSYALTTQPNFIIHLTLSVCVVAAGLFFGITTLEWLVVILTITSGLALELINTSIESAVDLITQEWHISAKIAKDVSASAMLVYAIGATLIATVLFAPKFYYLIY